MGLELLVLTAEELGRQAPLVLSVAHSRLGGLTRDLCALHNTMGSRERERSSGD